MFTRCTIENASNVKKYKIILLIFLSLQCSNICIKAMDENSCIVNNEESNKNKNNSTLISGIGSKQWLMILKAFEIHDKESKDLIEIFAKSQNPSLEKILAKELLANWDLIAKTEYLRLPHPINKIENYLLIDKAEKYQLRLLIIAIDVNSIGKVIGAKVISPKAVNSQEIPVDLARFKEYICRPAFKDGHFISGSFTSTIIIDYTFTKEMKK